MSEAFVLSIVLAVIGAALWIGSFVAFSRDDMTKQPSFLYLGFIGSLFFAAAAVATVVGIAQLILAAVA